MPNGVSIANKYSMNENEKLVQSTAQGCCAFTASGIVHSQHRGFGHSSVANKMPNADTFGNSGIQDSGIRDFGDSKFGDSGIPAFGDSGMPSGIRGLKCLREYVERTSTP